MFTLDDPNRACYTQTDLPGARTNFWNTATENSHFRRYAYFWLLRTDLLAHAQKNFCFTAAELINEYITDGQSMLEGANLNID